MFALKSFFVEANADTYLLQCIRDVGMWVQRRADMDWGMVEIQDRTTNQKFKIQDLQDPSDFFWLRGIQYPRNFRKSNEIFVPKWSGFRSISIDNLQDLNILDPTFSSQNARSTGSIGKFPVIGYHTKSVSSQECQAFTEMAQSDLCADEPLTPINK